MILNMLVLDAVKMETGLKKLIMADVALMQFLAKEQSYIIEYDFIFGRKHKLTEEHEMFEN